MPIRQRRWPHWSLPWSWVLTLGLGAALAQFAQTPDLKFSPVQVGTGSDQSWKAESEYVQTSIKDAFEGDHLMVNSL